MNRKQKGKDNITRYADSILRKGLNIKKYVTD